MQANVLRYLASPSLPRFEFIRNGVKPYDFFLVRLRFFRQDCLQKRRKRHEIIHLKGFMITPIEIIAVVGFLALATLVVLFLYGLGSLRNAYDGILERERIRRFYQRLEEQEFRKAKEALDRGDIKKYEFHRSCYNSLVAQGKEEQMKGKG